MRFQFDFFGLKAPLWLPLTKQLFKEQGIFEKEALMSFVRLCMEKEYRELHYLSIELVQHQLSTQNQDFIHFLEELIITKSWWDTVDWLVKLVGWHFERFPELIHQTVWKWAKSNNIWLIRSSILFQLKYKDKTDAKLLFELIKYNAETKEFFIQKGGGWALREYSKTNPAAVIEFISENNLPSLTRREGLKWLRKKGEFRRCKALMR